MTKYTKKNLISKIIDLFEGFKTNWDEHVDYWDSQPAGLHNDVAEFAVYVETLLAQPSAKQELDDIFVFVEQVLSEGDEEVKDAIATSFLENIVNTLEPDTEKTRRFSSLLGPQSRHFCVEWDKFSGGNLSELSAKE